MESKVFRSGSYVWECKSSPEYLGGSIDASYIKRAMLDVKKRWAKEGKMPSGYYYVFPINYVSNSLRQELEKFKNEYRGQVDINYYDCDQVQKLINNLSKLSNMQSLIDYIKQVQEK